MRCADQQPIQPRTKERAVNARFFSPAISTLSGCARRLATRAGVLGLLLLLALGAAGVAGEQPPPRSSGPGPGDVTGPQPVPALTTDLSFLPTISEDGIGPAKTPSQVASVLQVLGLLTFITVAPGLLLMVTAFTRIMIVLGFVRRALGTQTTPPDQVLVGLALILTIFVMAPTWQKCWQQGLEPYLEDSRDPATGQTMTQKEMLARVLAPQREFMFSCLEANDSEEELMFFMGVSGHQRAATDGTKYWLGENDRRVLQFTELRHADIPTLVLVPSFICSELKRSFWMGFLLYLPFLILDMVIASVLMSMGMMMLPPAMISLPFKLVLFILIDGWRLLLEALVTSFPPDMLLFLEAIT